MIYQNVKEGIFIQRDNRFIARVNVDGKEEVVHVKNTGRCKELLIPGVKVILEVASNPARKTKFDLITVYKESVGWVNIDSQIPNDVVAEYLESRPAPFENVTFIKREYTFGSSRFDFYMEAGEEKILLEVKGCTLEKNGMGYFPDAPTTRGVKHLKELINARKQGYRCYLAYVIAMEHVGHVLPNGETHPAYVSAIEEAKDAGVEIIYLSCKVTPNEITAKTKP